MLKQETFNTVIIGASAAGLACAACLQKQGVPFVLLEQHPYVANAWRHHYDRLHLNTEKKHSCLPYFSYPENAPTYISKAQLIKYLEEYVSHFNLSPRFNQRVLSARHNGLTWEIIAQNRFVADNVIIATGFNRKPFFPFYEGLQHTAIPVVHSSAYKNGMQYKGKRVLVVGFGNSACEISICLHEHGAYPSLSVKGPVNIIPRDSSTGKLNNFLHSFSWVTKLAPALIDAVNAPALRSKYGDYNKYGLKKLPYGPNVQIVKHKRVPLLDIGTFELIRKGDIKIYPAIEKFLPNSVCFKDGSEHAFDMVILGTGYRSAVSEFLPQACKVTDIEGRPLKSGMESSLAGLYFCGFYPSPSGMLHQIGIEAKKIASSIKNKFTRPFFHSSQ